MGDRDVLVVGGGPAGISTAIALRLEGLRVTIILVLPDFEL